MRLIKERTENRIAIYEDNYEHTISKFIRLSEIAKKDFSELKDSQICVIQYQGERYKRIYAIEFDIAQFANIPSDYQLVRELQPI